MEHALKTKNEKVELFGEHLEKVLESFPSHNEQEDELIMAFLESPGQLDFSMTAFSINEVKSVISKLNVKKAAGYNLITAKILSYH